MGAFVKLAAQSGLPSTELVFVRALFQGTIVEWTVQVGQSVQEEDVVALIETDKVTVDIKATMAGVVTQQFGGV